MNSPSGGSSHYTFRKDGCNPITIPKYEPIKVVYVRMVKAVVESETANQSEEGNNENFGRIHEVTLQTRNCS